MRNETKLSMVEKVVIALILIVIAVVAVAAANVEKASAQTVILEDGATFDGGICWEADGTEGLANYDGQCITPADYDVLYSFEALSTVPSANPNAGGESIAKQAGITAGSLRASERPRFFGGAELPTFTLVVSGLHRTAIYAL